MNTHDLKLAFYKHLISLTPTGFGTLKPQEVFDLHTHNRDRGIRRGHVILSEPDTIAFGNGVYTRITGMYQIDLWFPRRASGALKTINGAVDLHVRHFFPANGRGLTLRHGQTEAHILSRPNQRTMDRDGAYLREMIEVDFHVDDFPSA